MLGQLRGNTVWRSALAALAVLALAVKILVPPGFMPGTSLAQPIVLCSGQGPMTIMMVIDDGDHHGPSKAPHGTADHPCAFAGIGATSLAADFDGPLVLPVFARTTHVAAVIHAVAPGRGMAAPPPPSHAPPVFRA